jgi:hypothetical protein
MPLDLFARSSYSGGCYGTSSSTFARCRGRPRFCALDGSAAAQILLPGKARRARPVHADPERDLPGLQELPLLRLVHGLAPKQVQRLRVRERARRL